LRIEYDQGRQLRGMARFSFDKRPGFWLKVIAIE
jgi:hypothetical protein